MKQYLLNSSVLTSFGQWSYETLTLEQAKILVQRGEWISAIGHKPTAEFLAKTLEITVEYDRHAIEMVNGDQAIVFRFNFDKRLEQWQEISVEKLRALSWQLGLLKRTK